MLGFTVFLVHFTMHFSCIKPIKSQVNPVIQSLFSHEDTLFPECISDSTSDSEFVFGDITGKNVLHITPANRLLLLRCQAKYRIRWLAHKPVGSIIYKGGSYDDKIQQYTIQLNIFLDTPDFSRVLRCESFSNPVLAAHIFLNLVNPQVSTVASFKPSSSTFFIARSTPHRKLSFVPCVAKGFQRYDRMSLVKLDSRSEPLEKNPPNCAICTCFANSQCNERSFHEKKRPETSRSFFPVIPACARKGWYGCTTCAVGTNLVSAETKVADCNGDGLHSCEDFAISYASGLSDCRTLSVPDIAFNERFRHCINQAKENFTKLETSLDDYDARIGFRIHQALDTRSMYQCISSNEDLMIYRTHTMFPLSPERKVNASIILEDGPTVPSPFIYCKPDDLVHNVELYLAKCDSIIECDLRFRDMRPYVTAIEASYGNGTLHVFIKKTNGTEPLKAEFSGFVLCISTFRPQGEPNAFGYVHEHDYLSHGLDGTASQKSQSDSVHQVSFDNRVSTWQWNTTISEDTENNISCRARSIISGKFVRAELSLNLAARRVDQPKIEPAEDGITKYTALVASTVALLIGVLLIVIFVLWRKYRNSTSKLRNLTKDEMDEFYCGLQNDAGSGGVDEDYFGFSESMIISSSRLQISSTILGMGEFGIVFKGTLDDQCVAVKTCKSHAEVEYFKAFLKEIKLMAYIHEHPNVVKFYGAVTDRIQERKCSAVIEYAPYGNLNKYLLDHSASYVHEAPGLPTPEVDISVMQAEIVTLSYSILLEFCKQIALGMEFLSTKNIIHGDLAARNILVFPNNVVKVTDFGLSRKLYDCAIYTKTKQTPLPWRWMAPESLRYFQFTIKSDIWSFGITLWEIFSMAQVPFSGVTWTADFMDQLQDGQRLPKPRYANDDVYLWMMKCWEYDPEKRPTFSHCRMFLEDLASQQPRNDTNYIVFDAQGTHF